MYQNIALYATGKGQGRMLFERFTKFGHTVSQARNHVENHASVRFLLQHVRVRGTGLEQYIFERQVNDRQRGKNFLKESIDRF